MTPPASRTRRSASAISTANRITSALRASVFLNESVTLEHVRHGRDTRERAELAHEMRLAGVARVERERRPRTHRRLLHQPHGMLKAYDARERLRAVADMAR